VAALAQVGEMTALLAKVVASGVRHPVGYWAAVREQMYEMLKSCWLPGLVAATAFGFSVPGVMAGNHMNLFGTPERTSGVMVGVRDFVPTAVGVLVAAVIGTSLTVDLAARRVREEFDAMKLLGVDPVREVILPRIIALTLMAGLINMVAFVFAQTGAWLADVELGANSHAFAADLFNNATTTDWWASVTKTFVFGLIVATVCAYKGYHAQGGQIGVGRAVNQAVVISFAAIYSVNFCFTNLLFGLNPDLMVYR
jgi:phospholipid/cholesterol/gamma-HCH transport system permease protein